MEHTDCVNTGKEIKYPKWRHEKKFMISMCDYLSLSQKLKIIMKPDANADNDGRYKITSIYFDNFYDKALNEKRHGLSKREKFRIRYYNDNTDFINLEKKVKQNGLCYKSKCRISQEELDYISVGKWQFLKKHPEAVCRELGYKMETQLLRPKSRVSYIREPYIYDQGNVRVTFDFVETGPIICEVKYDEFLPSTISKILSPHLLRLQAFSKYQHSRITY